MEPLTALLMALTTGLLLKSFSLLKRKTGGKLEGFKSSFNENTLGKC